MKRKRPDGKDAKQANSYLPQHDDGLQREKRFRMDIPSQVVVPDTIHGQVNAIELADTQSGDLLIVSRSCLYRMRSVHDKIASIVQATLSHLLPPGVIGLIHAYDDKCMFETKSVVPAKFQHGKKTVGGSLSYSSHDQATALLSHDGYSMLLTRPSQSFESHLFCYWSDVAYHPIWRQWVGVTITNITLACQADFDSRHLNTNLIGYSNSARAIRVDRNGLVWTVDTSATCISVYPCCQDLAQFSTKNGKHFHDTGTIMITEMAPDHKGGVFYISNDTLWHLDASMTLERRRQMVKNIFPYEWTHLMYDSFRGGLFYVMNHMVYFLALAF